jgi:hypothetical protein
MWYWVVLLIVTVLMSALVVFVIVGLIEVLREPIVAGRADNDLGS